MMQPLLSPLRRGFCTSAARLEGSTGVQTSRAIVFKQHGDPKAVLEGHSYDLPALQKGEIRVEMQLCAVNPADINVIQGVYPAKPKVLDDIGDVPMTIVGNEACGIITGLAEPSQSLKIGDLVSMAKSQLGVWQSHINLPQTHVIPVRSQPTISAPQAATLSINPPTALRMLTDYIPLNPKDRQSTKKQWVIQNGANSAVGVAVIQIAKEWGVGTINLVRSRPNFDELETSLKALGADYVMTYDDFLEKSSRAKIKEWTKGGELKLGLNCVGGKETTEIVKLLDLEGRLVTYGGMAKTSLKIPPSLFIFKKLRLDGFWLGNWVDTHPTERGTMMRDLAQMTADGKLKEPDWEVVELAGTDAVVTGTIREVMRKAEEGRGKKVLLKWV